MKLITPEKRFLLPQDHALFNNCHASTITRLPGGELAAALRSAPPLRPAVLPAKTQLARDGAQARLPIPPPSRAARALSVSGLALHVLADGDSFDLRARRVRHA